MQAYSVFGREVSQRRQSERQRRAAHQKTLMELEERRSLALLANMLPLSIVKRLSVGSQTLFRVRSCAACSCGRICMHLLYEAANAT